MRRDYHPYPRSGSPRRTNGTFTVYDRQSRPTAEREISFPTLDRSPHRYIVPVEAAAKWHGYRGRRLFLDSDRFQNISAVRLIR